MHLNADQRLVIDRGQPVPLVVDHQERVLIRKEAFEQVQNDFSVAETYLAVEKVLNQDDDPGLDSYQQYKQSIGATSSQWTCVPPTRQPKFAPRWSFRTTAKTRA